MKIYQSHRAQGVVHMIWDEVKVSQLTILKQELIHHLNSMRTILTINLQQAHPRHNLLTPLLIILLMISKKNLHQPTAQITASHQLPHTSLLTNRAWIVCTLTSHLPLCKTTR
ncbi:hypothetical protein GIB67_017300 [Kingdonia uniflora]|uniref:Uncharacterized protein n=1 Tax=Kingdonia uniflora TaxID=39325 RepID=A0A7J7MSM4_9MAGN|nr:hypothetical protein GIB67_017300 [Kingdonia uniflora]